MGRKAAFLVLSELHVEQSLWDKAVKQQWTASSIFSFSSRVFPVCAVLGLCFVSVTPAGRGLWEKKTRLSFLQSSYIDASWRQFKNDKIQFKCEITHLVFSHMNPLSVCSVRENKSLFHTCVPEDIQGVWSSSMFICSCSVASSFSTPVKTRVTVNS